ncbi:hypothetical protein ACFFVB_00820 [Formosa undariae]|uniref:Uncharacterized protein n=1 Tax=Formosa undariae TaxID=1325436 RepID=A0ABV5EWP9_9FLAO
MKHISLIALTIFALAFTSCESDDDNNEPTEETDIENLYAVFWRVNTADGRVNYVSLVEDIMDGEIDPANAIEVSGYSRFFAQQDAGYFIIGDGEDLSFTRYNVSEDGKTIEKGDKFSFINKGVTSLQKRNVFLSDTKAYYIDNTQGQIIIWNPEEMIITGSFDLPTEFANGYQGFTTELGYGNYLLNGNKLNIPVGWINFDNNTHLDKTGLAVIDVENDVVLSYSEDTRCALAVEPAFTPNGDAYYGVSERYHFSTAARTKEDCGCILKVASGATTFDQDYDPYFMNQIEGEQVGIGLTNSFQLDHGYVKVLDTDVLPWSPDVEGINYYGLVWETYEINLAENTILGKVDRPLVPSYSENIFKFDEDSYGTIKTINNEDYKVVKYAIDGSYIEGIQVPGYISNMQRIR